MTYKSGSISGVRSLDIITGVDLGDVAIPKVAESLGACLLSIA